MADINYHIRLTLNVKYIDEYGSIKTRRAQEGEFDLVLDSTGMRQTRPEGEWGEYLGNGQWIWWKIMGFFGGSPIKAGGYTIKATWLADNSRFAQKNFTIA